MQKAIKRTTQINTEELYYQALNFAFEKFIAEEKKRHVFTELRLLKAIEAARTLYR